MARQSNNFQFHRGDTKPFVLAFTTVAGVPIDITGSILWITIKRSVDDLDVNAVIQKKVTFPETQESADGLGSITLGSDETRLIDPGIYLYDMQYVIPGDPPIVSTIISGRISILPDVTRNDGS